MSDLSKVLRQLNSLLGDHEFREEIKVYRCAYQRLKIRLRNNTFIAQLKQLTTLTRQLEDKYPVTLIQNYGKQIHEKSCKKQRHSIIAFKNLISDMIVYIDKTLDKMLHVYCLTQTNFKVGHLIHHLIVLRTSISRLCICYKALLVYSSDLFMEISTRKFMLDQKISTEVESKSTNSGRSQLTDISVHRILLKHNCKPRINRDAASGKDLNDFVSCDSININTEETIGPLIDREKFQICKSKISE